MKKAELISALDELIAEGALSEQARGLTDEIHQKFPAMSKATFKENVRQGHSDKLEFVQHEQQARSIAWYFISETEDEYCTLRLDHEDWIDSFGHANEYLRQGFSPVGHVSVQPPLDITSGDPKLSRPTYFMSPKEREEKLKNLMRAVHYGSLGTGLLDDDDNVVRANQALTKEEWVKQSAAVIQEVYGTSARYSDAIIPAETCLLDPGEEYVLTVVANDDDTATCQATLAGDGEGRVVDTVTFTREPDTTVAEWKSKFLIGASQTTKPQRMTRRQGEALNNVREARIQSRGTGA